MKFSFLLPIVLVSLCACRTGTVSPWSQSFVPPSQLDTERVHLEPLGPGHAELDHAAFSSSRAYLQRTLRWGDWPREGMGVEENVADLRRHWTEFALRQAYAFTVLSPDRKRCLGCVYLKPERIPFGDDPSVLLAYWVIESELTGNLDRHLLQAVLEWIRTDWPFETVFIAPHLEDGRAHELAAEFKMRPIEVVSEGASDRAVFAWTPGSV